MFKNYLKIAWRDLVRHKGYTLINIAGLAAGIACCLLISLYVFDELSYDRYHAKADRIFKVATDIRNPEGEGEFALTPAPLAEALIRDFPEVENATRLFAFLGNVSVSYGDKRFNEQKMLAGDASFFAIFDVPFVAGDPKAALSQPNSVVLTEAMARKYFGDENPLGKVITVDVNTSFELKVSGVMHEIPANSHFHFDFLVSLSTFAMSRNPSFISNINFHTYVLLRPGASAQALEKKLPAAIKKYAAAQIADRFGQSYEERVAAGYSTAWSLVPLTAIHLHSQRKYEIEASGNILTVYAFAAIALIVLLIACINFMNLSTARAFNRAREIGVRKTIGSTRQQILRQFLAESIFISVLATMVALVLIELVMPGFNSLIGKQMRTDFFSRPELLVNLLGVALVTGLVAGSYPAFVLSRLQPTAVLKSASPTSTGVPWIRRGLVVFQFAICICLIIGTVVVREQLGFVLHKQLGFDKEHVLIVKRSQALGPAREAFKQQLVQHPAVHSAAASSTLPGKLFGMSTYGPLQAPAKRAKAMQEVFVDTDFFRTLGIRLVAGRKFSRDFSTDATAVILNQAAAREFGWPNPLGHFLTQPGNPKWRVEVIGLVEDFHFESLHKPIQPLIIRFEPRYRYQYLSVRLGTEDIAAAVQFVKSTWEAFVPQHPFDYSFLDQDFEALYHAEQRTGKIISIFAMLAVFIACMGLLGLAAYAAETRTKEIGIRKVLGATVANVVALLSKDFVKLVLLANVIAWPVAWYAMNRWLQNFAYRIDISWWVFVLAGGLALVIALLTVSTQAVRAALANPVKALRYE